ncbi:hypothetical protein BKA69DRAFT_623230 [Paraphysoderma sedebokerense]|nr:hypothetical protein BKA69DRAFT_623230 [Paraphysoderma sedebokerense]
MVSDAQSPTNNTEPSPLKFPTKDDERLKKTILSCGDMFVRYRKCANRSAEKAKSDPDYKALIAHSNQTKNDRLKLLYQRRADNVLMMSIVRECGYIRTPLQDCIASHGCDDLKRVRDEYVMSKKGVLNTEERAQAFVLAGRVNECVRMYQFAMNVCVNLEKEGLKDSGIEKVFDLENLSKVEIQKVSSKDLGVSVDSRNEKN